MSMFEEVKEVPKYAVRSKSRTILEEFLKSKLRIAKLNQDLITGKARAFVATLGQVSKSHNYPIKVHYRLEDNSIYLERIDQD
ncbi:MAG: hypothetical protein ABR962_10540 [Candidatus Bathyarchaeia archaeon]|jgi:hypothetical protein